MATVEMFLSCEKACALLLHTSVALARWLRIKQPLMRGVRGLVHSHQLHVGLGVCRSWGAFDGTTEALHPVALFATSAPL